MKIIDVELIWVYLPLDCPLCGRHRLEYSIKENKIQCEKCEADHDTLNYHIQEQLKHKCE